MNDKLEKCPICLQPIGAEKLGSLTQWISQCNCLAEKAKEEDYRVESVVFCKACKKRIQDGESDGSFTQFVLRPDLCGCDEPVPYYKSQVVFSKSKQIASAAASESAEALELEEDFPRDRYEPVKFLGRGSSGSVYLARDRFLRKAVAVKMLICDSEDAAVSFQAEAKILSKLQHENIVSVYDLGVTEDGSPYMVLEPVDGISLSELLKLEGSLEPVFACEILLQILSALEYTHAKSVFHRDLKPSNVLIYQSENGETHVKLVDFGIASVSQVTTLTEQGLTLSGTPEYMSPDQTRGIKYGAKSEVYSIGCLLYEMISGIPPFQGDTAMETISLHAHEDVPELPGEVDERFRRIVTRCLEKEPENRFSTVVSLRDEVLEFLKHASTEPSHRSSESERDRRIDESIHVRARRLRAVWFAVFLALIGIPIWLHYSPKGVEESENEKEKSEREVLDKRNLSELAGMCTEDLCGGNIQVPSMGRVMDSATGIEMSDESLKQIKESGKRPKRLVLSMGSISNEGLKYLRGMPLEYLELSGTKIDDAGIDNLLSLKRIQFLAIAGTTVSAEGVAKLKALPRLNYLRIHRCNLDDSIWKSVSLLENLELLDVFDNPKIHGQGMKMLTANKRLHFLNLSGDSVRPENFKDLKAIESLRTLKLRFMKLNKESIEHILALKQIVELDISYSTVNQEKLKMFSSMKYLRRFKIVGLNPTLKTLRYLEKSLPGCRIYK